MSRRLVLQHRQNSREDSFMEAAHFFAHTGHDHSITLDFFDVTSFSGSPE